MATIINNPSDRVPAEDSGVGVVVGLIVAVILVVLFFMFAWPTIRNNNVGSGTYTPADTNTPGTSANINLTVPGASPSANP
jgi:hypothetical protein